MLHYEHIKEGDFVKNIVEKSNTLNLMRMCNPNQAMGLTEFRFFCLYLSKLNAREPDKRTVQISLDYFQQLFNAKINTTQFNQKIYSILKRDITIIEDNKSTILNLYSKFEWTKNADAIEVTCNYDAVPYLFELKKNYTS